MNYVITKDASTKPFHKHWKFSVGSGHAHLALRTDYTRQLKFIHEELGIEYVRFHGIFHDDMNTLTHLGQQLPIPGGEVFTEQTFHACGVAYDNVLSVGMKPFVELGFMPKLLASGEQKSMFWYGGNISMPKEEQAWREYIQAFLRFLIHRYGEEEVRTWYFEVWNEPDLPVFFAGTQKDYFRLYEITARAVKEVNQGLRVGGPATSGSKWIADFVSYCKEHEVPVDFVSTHQYAGDPIAGVEEKNAMQDGMDQTEIAVKMMEALNYAEKKTFLGGWRTLMPDKSETEDIPGDTFRISAGIVKEQAEGLPVYYTEWNENAIFGAATNDTRKVAAYDVKAALEVEDKVAGSSIWCFSDIFEEMHQFPQEFHGGFGMLTLNGVPKPVFYAMKLLGEVGDERIDLGEHATEGEVGIAAFRGEGTTDVVLFRQKMKNLELPKEKVDITVECDQRPRKVELYRIDEEHCNPLCIWQDMGCPADLNAKEVRELKEKSRMICEEPAYEWEDGKLLFSVELGVNDVYFIKIK